MSGQPPPAVHRAKPGPAGSALEINIDNTHSRG